MIRGEKICSYGRNENEKITHSTQRTEVNLRLQIILSFLFVYLLMDLTQPKWIP